MISMPSTAFRCMSEPLGGCAAGCGGAAGPNCAVGGSAAGVSAAIAGSSTAAREGPAAAAAASAAGPAVFGVAFGSAAGGAFVPIAGAAATPAGCTSRGAAADSSATAAAKTAGCAALGAGAGCDISFCSLPAGSMAASLGVSPGGVSPSSSAAPSTCTIERRRDFSSIISHHYMSSLNVSAATTTLSAHDGAGHQIAACGSRGGRFSQHTWGRQALNVTRGPRRRGGRGLGPLLSLSPSDVEGKEPPLGGASEALAFEPLPPPTAAGLDQVKRVATRPLFVLTCICAPPICSCPSSCWSSKLKASTVQETVSGRAGFGLL